MVAPDDSPNRMVDACPNLQSRAVARGRARGPAYMGDIDRAIRHCVRAMQRVSSIGVRAASVTVTAGPARGEGGGTLAHSCARYGAPKDVRVYSPTFGRSRHLLRHLSRSSKVYVPLRCAMNPDVLRRVHRYGKATVCGTVPKPRKRRAPAVGRPGRARAAARPRSGAGSARAPARSAAEIRIRGYASRAPDRTCRLPGRRGRGRRRSRSASRA